MDTKILQEIGLTDSEIKVYLALLELGASKKGPIVDKAKIASSKIYEVISKLIEKGLASFIIKDNVKYFNAAPPSRIKDYLEEKEVKLKEQENSLDKFMPQLNMVQKLLEGKTTAEIYAGWKGMQTVYNDLLESVKTGEEYFIFGASKGEDEKRVKSYYTRFSEKVAQKKLKAKLIFNENARGNIPEVEKKAEVKYLEQTTPSEILVYQNKTAIVLLEKEPLIILIKSNSVAKSFTEYFKVMWKLAKS